MSAATIETQVIGNIIPVLAGTRLRELAQTYSPVRTSYGSSDQVVIDRTILYTEQDPTQPATMKGDLWGHVLSVNGVAVPQPSFMAIDYHGEPICSKHYIAKNDSSLVPVAAGFTVVFKDDAGNFSHPTDYVKAAE